MSSLIAKPLSGAAMDVLSQLFFTGPTWDGNVSSKTGRDELFDLGLINRHDGWQWLTDHGAITAIDAGFGDKKDAWQRARSRRAR